MEKLPDPPDRNGPLAWFAQNSVAANVIMFVLLIGGAFIATTVTQEVFPEVEFELVVLQVPYPGASPAEVEDGVILAAEEAVRGLDGVKKVTATAAESVGTLTIEFIEGTNKDRALADVKSAVDRITSFPDNAEEPNVFLASNRTRVLSLVLYGDVPEKTMRAFAEQTRDELLQTPEITYVELSGVRTPEISVEVDEHDLRRYGLTLDAISARMRAASVQLPAGGVKTRRGEILLRTDERREIGSEFEDIVLSTRPDGSQLKLGDIAEVKDGFADTDEAAFFNGKRAMMVDVFRVGDQTPVEVSDAAKAYVEHLEKTLPTGMAAATWFDMSEMYQQRIDLLVRNAIMGLILVLLTLGLFLEIRLAFWVTLGIPVSFVGSMMFMPATDVTINMISLFAFIVVLGMVVDDAIVIGEAIYRLRQKGMERVDAAIAGVREVAVPVVFAVVTTMVAFAPMLFVPGFAGKFFRNIPIVVITVLGISLIEGLVILPAHLAHMEAPKDRGIFGFIHHQQQRFSRAIEWLIEKTYIPTLHFAMRRRYLTVAIGIAVLLSSLGLVFGGRVGFTFMPRIESDMVVAAVELPFGSAVEDTEAIRERLLASGEKALAELGEPEDIRGIFAQVGRQTMAKRGGPGGTRPSIGGHLAEVAAYVVPADERDFTAAELASRWREIMGEVPGVESLRFKYDTGGSGDAPVAFNLTHTDAEVLEKASEKLAAHLRTYAGVFDVDDGFSQGKEQIDLTLRPEAKRLGLTELEVGRQVRAAFFGSEATRLQRGRDEMRVYVRYPEAVRKSEYGFENLMIRTPMGGEVPLSSVAEVSRGFADTRIQREDGRRVARVTADIDTKTANANEVVGSVRESFLPGLLADVHGLDWSLGGEQQHQAETMGGLGKLFLLAVFVIYALLAVVFRNYFQPIVIMAAIPFGMVGAIVGHVVMGYDMSIMSMMGVVALAGVVVNDSLILVDAINVYRDDHEDLVHAVLDGGHRRFRPIILTSLTTFFGLAPMILETSVQARFLIPMALSLGFGIMFATFITLVIVPALYLILEDFKRIFRWTVDVYMGREPEVSLAPPPELSALGASMDPEE